MDQMIIVKTHITLTSINFKSQNSIKQIYHDFAKNINCYDAKRTPISLKNYVQNKIIKLMIAADDTEKKPEKEKESRFMVSSESADSQNSFMDHPESEQVAMFKKILADYANYNSSFSKSIRKAMLEMREENQYRKFALIFREFEIGYLKMSNRATLKTKREEYHRRAMFCRVGLMSLLNGNSTSVLERSFSDCVRSCSDRKVTKRNVFRFKPTLSYH